MKQVSTDNKRRPGPHTRAVLLLLMTVFLLSACGGSEGGSTAAVPSSNIVMTLPGVEPELPEDVTGSAATTGESTEKRSEAETTEAVTTEQETKAPAPTSADPASPGTFHLYSKEELLPVPDGIDRSQPDNGGWYPGEFVRDLGTGTVTVNWDRPAALQNMLDKYGAIYHKNKDQKVIYLTFDCGGTCSVADLNRILDTLKAKNVQAIFFIPGDFLCGSLNRDGEYVIPEKAEALKRIVAEGHLIGNHTHTHPKMAEQSDEAFIDQLNNMQLLINEALGYEYQLTYYRPPSGIYSERDLYLAHKMGYHTTFWSFAYYDYDISKQKEVSAALELTKTKLHDGCVYLLHAMSPTNQTILGDFIDYARAQGYELRRIDR